MRTPGQGLHSIDAEVERVLRRRSAAGSRGALGLGTWQGIYLWEHRRRGAQRQVIVQVLGA